MAPHKPAGTLRQCGLTAAIGLLVGLFRRVCSVLGLRVCGIYSKPLTPSAETIPEIPGLSFRLFGRDECEALISRSRRHELDMTGAFIRDALEKGDICATILADDAVVSYLWFAFTPTHDYKGVHISFRESDLYCYKAFTLPEFRGRRLPRVFRILGERYCMARGATHAIAYIDIHNLPSIHAMTAQGGQRIGFAGYFRKGSLFLPFRTPGVRKRGIDFFLPTGSTQVQSGASRSHELPGNAVLNEKSH